MLLKYIKHLFAKFSKATATYLVFFLNAQRFFRVKIKQLISRRRNNDSVCEKEKEEGAAR